jgi:RNA polymerase sigma-70 factor (ECF subfamily)
VEKPVAEPDPVRPGRASAPDEFERFVAAVEPGLRRALAAGYGSEVGRDAAIDALVWAWRNWGRVRRISNPGGYLYRVGQSSARRRVRRRHPPEAAMRPESSTGPDALMFEPELLRALSQLSVRQRAAVVLVHGYEFTLGEAGAAMGCSSSSVRNHVARALRRLRRSLGVTDEA